MNILNYITGGASIYDALSRGQPVTWMTSCLRELNAFVLNLQGILWFIWVVASVKPEILKNVGQLITTLPDGFTAHKGIQRVYDARRKMIETGEGVDWATAEALAFATLLIEGIVEHLFIALKC